MKVELADRALADLRAIADHVGLDNPKAAARLVERILARMRQLARFPQSGRMVPERQHADARELIEGNYRIAYVVAKNAVTIVAVVEGHRRMPLDRLQSNTSDEE